MEKFCNDMESTPVGVIVGLFQAISQKLPAFTEWDTSKHHHLLNSNPDVCQTMSEVRQHVTRYGAFQTPVSLRSNRLTCSRILSSQSVQLDIQPQ